MLQSRGIYRKEYEANTLRESLFGKGKVHLPDSHLGKKVSISKPNVETV
ncbi:hypothetical protein [Oceanobacillus zhaokaii]|nr:hypothetical protein [Oceanobacillus zhaokaii]